MSRFDKKLRAARRAPAQAPGFTLIEVLICMALFAVGFAAIAVILPAGTMMQRKIEDSAEVTVSGRNALEIMKAKGIHQLTYAWTGEMNNLDLVDVSTIKMERVPPTGSPYFAWDMETAAFSCVGGNVNGFGSINIASGQAAREYFNVDGDTVIWQQNDDLSGFNGYGTGYENPLHLSDHDGGFGANQAMNAPNRMNSIGDHTNLRLGRIHVYKNRMWPGAPGYYSRLDFSYPSSILSVTGRTCASYVLISNYSKQYDAQAVDCQDPVRAANEWSASCVTLRKNQGDEWPELGNYNAVSNAGDAGDLYQNDAYSMRSIGAPGSAFGTTWYRYAVGFDYGNTYHVNMAAIGLPATGGDPAHPTPAYRAGNLGMWSENANYPAECVGRSYPWGSGLGHPLPPCLVAQPMRDQGLAATAGYDGHILPVPMHVPALVYDYQNDLILIRYGQVFAQNPASPRSTRLTNFWSKYPVNSPIANPNNWVDRKLKVGDSFLASPGNYAMTVTQVLDVKAEAARVNAALGETLDWSDGTYEVIRVSPPLRSTNYTPNKTSILFNSHRANWLSRNTEVTDSSLYQLIIGVPPLAGGSNPWRSTLQTDPNHGIIFRSLDNMTD